MLQNIIVWLIVAACLIVAVAALARRFRSKKPGCHCGKDTCDGCPLG